VFFVDAGSFLSTNNCNKLFYDKNLCYCAILCSVDGVTGVRGKKRRRAAKEMAGDDGAAGMKPSDSTANLIDDTENELARQRAASRCVCARARPIFPSQKSSAISY
jgi:hypothetical protein